MNLTLEVLIDALFSYGGWILGLVLSVLEIREARQTATKTDVLLEEIRKLKAENVLLQVNPDPIRPTLQLTTDQYQSIAGQIRDIADTEQYRE